MKHQRTQKKILVTGGAGYIGSHTVLELLEADYSVVVVDNLSNSSQESLKRVEELTGRTLEFIKLDILDKPALAAAFDAEGRWTPGSGKPRRQMPPDSF